MLSFGGCDYLSLSSDRRVIAAGRRAFLQFGAGARGSRATVGETEPLVELEKVMLQIFGAPVITFPSGWLAAGAAAAALEPAHGGIFVINGSHPAAVGGARATGRKVVFAARDPKNLQKAVANCKRPLVLADAADLPSRNLLPLREYYQITRAAGGTLLIDDAHGVGVLGARGRGAAEYLNLPKTNLVIAGSLGKTFGAQGGFVTGSRDFCSHVRARAAAFKGATPLAPPMAAAAAASASILYKGGAVLREKLQKNIQIAVELWESLSLPTGADALPWLNIILNHSSAARNRAHYLKITKKLLLQGISVPHVEYFNGPPGGYLRFTIATNHCVADFEYLGSVLKKIL